MNNDKLAEKIRSALTGPGYDSVLKMEADWGETSAVIKSVLDAHRDEMNDEDARVLVEFLSGRIEEGKASLDENGNYGPIDGFDHGTLWSPKKYLSDIERIRDKLRKKMG